MRMNYPAVARSAASYALHGTTIPDPYDWLENPDSTETREFVLGQNKFFTDFMTSGDGEDTGVVLRESLKTDISKVFPPCTSPPFPYGKYYYYYHNTGVENQSKLYRNTILTPGGDGEEVFLDPNLFSADGTTALVSTAWSKNHKHFAYALTEKGSDWSSIRIRSGEGDNDKKDMMDRCDWVKFSGITWVGDDGFFYTRFPSLASGQDKGAETDKTVDGCIYYHVVGTEQSEDVMILGIPEYPNQIPSAVVSDCGKYLLANITNGCEPENLVWVSVIPSGFAKDPKNHPLSFNKFLNEWNAEYKFIGNNANSFFFETTLGAPKKRVVSFDYPSAEPKELITESSKAGTVLTSAAIAGKNTLLLKYLEDVKDVMYYCSLSSVIAGSHTLKKLDLPIGTISRYCCDRDTDFVSLKVASFTLPGRSYYFKATDESMNDVELVKFRDDEVNGHNPDDYITKQIFVEVDTNIPDAPNDKTKIPICVVHHKDVDMTTPQPTLLYGYGGFNIPLTPAFSPSRLVFMKHLGGIFVVANIRGGGEYGENWHNQGRKKHKYNCFTDFISCAKYLNSQPFCKPQSLGIMGGSNGGLLVAACANIAPQEFGAVVAQVGVMDMYKFHKFTIGHAWTSDFGNPDTEEDFKVLETYSPIHNVKANTKYPPILVTTGDHDDRVVPLHSLKYLATIQHHNPDIMKSGPFLGRIEVAAGHGAGKPTSKIVDEMADTYAFIGRCLKAKYRS
eukprot:Tbor_TRINITY_DN5509_c4_g14::TRINITY_DN5509_c4_g14_i1::g.13321::m.13321/K01322/PREP; prolyl oligopeptidase